MPDHPQLTPTLGGIRLGLEAADHFDAIDQLAGVLGEILDPADAMRISAAAVARESLASTHVGNRVALPHARLPELPAFLVTIGLCAQPVPWGPDKAPVRLVLLSAVPASANTAYLQFMRAFMLAFRNASLAAELHACSDSPCLRNWLQRHLRLT